MRDFDPDDRPHRDPPTRHDPRVGRGAGGDADGGDADGGTGGSVAESPEWRSGHPGGAHAGDVDPGDAPTGDPQRGSSAERWLDAIDAIDAIDDPVASERPFEGRLGVWVLPLLAVLAITALFAPSLREATAPPPDPALLQAAGPPPVVAPTGDLVTAYESRRTASVRIEAFCLDSSPRTPPLGIGTGFFVDDAGTLVTAYHVIDPTNTRFNCPVRHRAVTTDELRYPLELVGFDAYFDLAVMRADTDDLAVPFVPLAARGPRPGDEIVAIGNSRNDFLEARAGQVTRLGVRAARANFADDTIELTAALAPGDSGGPVLNSAGEAVGVVSYISFNPSALDSGDYVPPFLRGLVRPSFASYAVPVAADDELLAGLLEGERRDVPVVGLSWGGGFASSYVPGETPVDLGPRPGTIIQFVAEGGPAEAAGLQALEQEAIRDASGRVVRVDVSADVVVAVDGEPTADLDDLMRIVRSYRIGDTVTLTVQRGNATLQIELELGARRSVFGTLE